jgi:hypothetical protein
MSSLWTAWTTLRVAPSAHRLYDYGDDDVKIQLSRCKVVDFSLLKWETFRY